MGLRLSASSLKTHPHPVLPLEGEGTLRLCFEQDEALHWVGTLNAWHKFFVAD